MSSDMRQNLATKEWVVMMEGHYEKPSDYKWEVDKLSDAPKYDPKCPFCEMKNLGQERFSYPEEGEWQVKCLANKFPKLSVSPSASHCVERKKEGVFSKMSGCGANDIFLEHPVHNQTIGTMTNEEVRLIVRAYHRRFCELAESTLFISIFRNNGKGSGGSLRHPHSQLVSTRFVPVRTRNNLYEAEHYFNNEGECVYCVMLEQELKSGKRVIYENKHFVAFIPFAASVAYEIYIMPRRHSASFMNVSEEELMAFADALHHVTYKMVTNLDNPSYNYILRCAPNPMAKVPFYHWYLQILPRMYPPGAFQTGTGIMVNSVLPEKAAITLRD